MRKLKGLFLVFLLVGFNAYASESEPDYPVSIVYESSGSQDVGRAILYIPNKYTDMVLGGVSLVVGEDKTLIIPSTYNDSEGMGEKYEKEGFSMVVFYGTKNEVKNLSAIITYDHDNADGSITLCNKRKKVEFKDIM